MPTGQSCLGNIRSGAAKRRAGRFFKFVENLPRPLSVVDLGGSAEMWSRWGISGDHRLHITLINNHHMDISHRNEHLPGEFIRERREDVLDLSPDDLAAFDVIFSNSMLEHLNSREDQARLADRIIKTGKPFFVQVPNKHCIVDPHFPHPLAPSFAALPRAVQARMLTMPWVAGAVLRTTSRHWNACTSIRRSRAAIWRGCFPKRRLIPNGRWACRCRLSRPAGTHECCRPPHLRSCPPDCGALWRRRIGISFDQHPDTTEAKQ